MRLRRRNKTSFALFLFALIILVVGVANYNVLLWSQSRIIENEAVRTAEVVTHQALSSRTVYAEVIAQKIQQDGFGIDENFHQTPGFVPIPAQYLKFVAREVRENNHGLYNYTPLSKWNLEPSQGIEDDFQRWAWSRLESQDEENPDGPIDWQPVWRFEQVDGVRTLRYMSADAAAADNCVSCHSEREQRPEIIERRLAAGVAPGKEWKRHQLLGALEVNVPVDQSETLAAAQADTTLAIVMVISLGGMLAAILLSWRDIRRERAATAYFEQQAMLDPLTRLLNRVGLEESADALLHKSKAMGSSVCVLFIDLDGFKPVNDQFGHKVGDELLKLVADRIRQVVRESDIVARQGGDEFLIVMENPSTSSYYKTIAQQLVDILSRPFYIDGHSINISASIGIASAPEQGQVFRDLVRKADQAMYEAKNLGRSGFVMYSDG